LVRLDVTIQTDEEHHSMQVTGQYFAQLFETCRMNNEERTWGRRLMAGYIYYRGTENFTAVEITGWCPLVLLVKVGWRKSQAFENEGKTTRTGYPDYAAVERRED